MIAYYVEIKWSGVHLAYLAYFVIGIAIGVFYLYQQKRVNGVSFREVVEQSLIEAVTLVVLWPIMAPAKLLAYYQFRNSKFKKSPTDEKQDETEE